MSSFANVAIFSGCISVSTAIFLLKTVVAVSLPVDKTKLRLAYGGECGEKIYSRLSISKKIEIICELLKNQIIFAKNIKLRKSQPYNK